MIAIVGAGPAGSYLAFTLASAGREVSLFEEHAVIGKPVQCTGIVTNVYDQFDLPKSIIRNELEEVRIHAGKKVTSIPLSEHVLDRHKLDDTLAKMAKKAGAQVFLQHKYVGREKNANGNSALFQTSDGTKRIPFSFLAGCDGPNSSVARTSGLDNSSKYYIAAQASVEGTYDKGVFDTYFGDVAPKFFAWSVPESKHVSRIGLATMESPGIHYKKFLAEQGGRSVDMLGGLIPVFNPRSKTMNDTTALIGDASGFVKATTGGGIITSMLQAELIAKKILGEPWKKEYSKLRFELWLHLRLRNMLNNFSQNDYEKLVGLMDSHRVKTILSKYPREYPSKFLYKLFLAEPRIAVLGLLKFGW